MQSLDLRRMTNRCILDPIYSGVPSEDLTRIRTRDEGLRIHVDWQCRSCSDISRQKARAIIDRYLTHDANISNGG